MTSFVDVLSRPAWEVAPRLLGSSIIREIDGFRLAGKIVETEAYDQTDAASHSYRGRTPRTDIMFGPPGRAYVYFTYGMHYCFNVVTGNEGQGSAVLIRALEPLEGLEMMRQNRRRSEASDLCSGPAKLCQALVINKTLNGHDLSRPPLTLRLGRALPAKAIIKGPRIGISRDTDRPWRFSIRVNPYVSRPQGLA